MLIMIRVKLSTCLGTLDEISQFLKNVQHLVPRTRVKIGNKPKTDKSETVYLSWIGVFTLNI